MVQTSNNIKQINKKDIQVTIGIMTYNRPKLLKKAIESVLSQTHENLEIMILDDNSDGDETKNVVHLYALKDTRIKYYKHERNKGIVGINFLLDNASSDYFMWLCDDDCIENDYIEKCLSYIVDNEDYVLVTGKTIFHSGEGVGHQADSINVENESSIERILNFYNSQLGTANNPDFGVINLKKIPNVRIKSIQGHDNIWVSNIAFLGKIKTLDDTHIYRLMGGSSQSLEKLAKIFRYSMFELNCPRCALFVNIMKDILFESDVLKSMSFLQRLYLAFRLTIVILLNGRKYIQRYRNRFMPLDVFETNDTNHEIAIPDFVQSAV